MSGEKAKSPLKNALKILLIALIVLVIIVAGYVAYVFIAYSRLDDNLVLTVSSSKVDKLEADKTYTMISFNIGFGAYEPDYSFFMDGGTESRAWSEERLKANMNGIADFLKEQDADIINLQEVDEDATRSYHYDEREFLEGELKGYSSVFAENWNSPFLFYPLTQPHGATKAGIMIFSKPAIESAIRRSFPVETSVMKVVDLDRCYCKSYIPVDSGRTLVVYNAHMSAYTSDGKIANEQLKMLVDDMKQEADNGRYVICSADFNKDLLGDSSKYFGITGEDYTWAQPFDTDALKGTSFSLYGSTNAPSCRVADAPYNDKQFVLTIDGFIVSSNIEVISEETIDTQFKYSDHNPVKMTFKLRS